MRIIFAIAVLLLLAGCASDKLFTNRLACTYAGDKAFVISLYGPIGVTSEIDEADAKRLAGKCGAAP
jgi:hypothetical protein